MVGRVRRVERMVEGEGRRLLGRGRGLQRVAGEPHRAGVRGWEGGWRWVARGGGGGGGPGEGEEQCCQQCTMGICEVTRQQCTMGMCPHHVSCLLAAVNWGPAAARHSYTDTASHFTAVASLCVPSYGISKPEHAARSGLLCAGTTVTPPSVPAVCSRI